MQRVASRAKRQHNFHPFNGRKGKKEARCPAQKKSYLPTQSCGHKNENSLGLYLVSINFNAYGSSTSLRHMLLIVNNLFPQKFKKNA